MGGQQAKPHQVFVEAAHLCKYVLVGRFAFCRRGIARNSWEQASGSAGLRIYKDKYCQVDEPESTEHGLSRAVPLPKDRCDIIYRWLISLSDWTSTESDTPFANPHLFES